MELLQLRYFQTVANFEHMTRAAEALSVSQPSLSKTINSLETQIGVKLFDRKGKYIKLNEAGRIFLSKVELALSALDDGVRRLNEIRNKETGHITLAFLAASPILPELLSNFRKNIPDVRFHLLQHLSGSQKFNFDLCISSLPLDVEGIKSIPLLTEEIFLAVPNNHKLAERNKIKLREAADEGFIYFKKGNALREITDNLCLIAGFSPHIIFESDDPSTVRGLIKAGQGVGFTPAISWGGTTGDSVKLIKIEDPECYRTIRLSWLENRYTSEVIDKFKEFTIEYFKKMI